MTEWVSQAPGAADLWSAPCWGSFGEGCTRYTRALNFLTASGVTGVKKFTRLPSGSRNRRERLPQGTHASDDTLDGLPRRDLADPFLEFGDLTVEGVRLNRIRRSRLRAKNGLGHSCVQTDQHRPRGEDDDVELLRWQRTGHALSLPHEAQVGLDELDPCNV